METELIFHHTQSLTSDTHHILSGLVPEQESQGEEDQQDLGPGEHHGGVRAVRGHGEALPAPPRHHHQAGREWRVCRPLATRWVSVSSISTWFQFQAESTSSWVSSSENLHNSSTPVRKYARSEMSGDFYTSKAPWRWVGLKCIVVFHGEFLGSGEQKQYWENTLRDVRRRWLEPNSGLNQSISRCELELNQYFSEHFYTELIRI